MTIIEHIPYFLEYCEKERHLLPKSIESYNRFLNRFKIWLKQSDLINLLPEGLSLKYIEEYKNYLLKQISPETNQPIIKKTQNYYLIAIRALLSYFIENDIPSLLPNKIKLLREDKSLNKNRFLNLKELEKILQIPKTSTIIGLRDKVLLEILFSTGLKITQLVSLNKDQVKINGDTRNFEIKISDKENIYPRFVYLSEKAINSLRKYLQARKDNEKALFINYKGPKTTSRRLTARSVENIVKEYGKKANFSFSLTPEILRTAYFLNILNRENEIEIIKNPLPHKVLMTQNYEFTIIKPQKMKFSKSPTWHAVEVAIREEIAWLKRCIPILPERFKRNSTLLTCDDCLLRKIAILIVSGKIKASELKTENGNDIWNGLIKQKNLPKTSKHGQEWHKKMMDVIYEYFKLQNYKVALEPVLNYGRADLGVYSKPNRPIYIEVDTVSLFKLWYNFSTMRNTTFLIVPSENNVIEFKI